MRLWVIGYEGDMGHGLVFIARETEDSIGVRVCGSLVRREMAISDLKYGSPLVVLGSL